MNKQELVAAVAEKANMSKKEAAKAVEAVVEVVKEALAKGEPVRIIGFGTFMVRQRGERRGRNPRTREEITIPARKAPVFKASSQLKELVNK